MIDQQRIWRAVNRQTTTEDMAAGLRRSHERMVRHIHESRDHVSPRWLERMKRHAFSLLVDAREVERQ